MTCKAIAGEPAAVRGGKARDEGGAGEGVVGDGASSLVLVAIIETWSASALNFTLSMICACSGQYEQTV